MKIHLVPHFHYDQCWVMKFDEYYDISLSIIKKVIDAIEKSEDFVFCLDQVILLQELESRNHDIWEKVKEHIKDGRIEIVGGGYNMPDTNLPMGESIVRNFLIGHKYLKEHFDIKPTWAWMIDVFGHSGQLPQILSGFGLKYYAFARGMGENSKTEFRWEGIDGTHLVGFWLPFTYGTGYLPFPNDYHELDQKLRSFSEMLQRVSSTNDIYIPLGSDFSEPQTQVIEYLKSHSSEIALQTVISRPSDYIESVLSQSPILSTIKGELQSDRFWRILPGVYSSRMWLKKAFRDLELSALTIEAMSAICWAFKREYPKKELDKLWETIAFLSFHDVLAGCSIDAVYRDVRERLEESKEIISSILESYFNYEKLCDTNYDLPIKCYVFNACPWARTGYIEVVSSSIEEADYSTYSVSDQNGNPLNCESYCSSGESRIVIEVRDAPPMSLFPLIIKKDKSRSAHIERGKDCTFIENRFFTIKFNRSSGCIESIRSKKENAEVIGGTSNYLIAEPDCGDLYYYRRPNVELSRPEKAIIFQSNLPGSKYKTYEFIDEASIRCINTDIFSEFTSSNCYRWRNEELLHWEQSTRIYRESPTIFFKVKITNRMRHFRLRVGFELPFQCDEFICEIPFGSICRTTRRKNNSEGLDGDFNTWPILNWANFSNGKLSLAFFNKGLPEIEYDNGKVYITILRSIDMVSWGDAGPAIQAPEALEQGIYEFEYGLYIHSSDIELLPREAYNFLTPMDVYFSKYADKEPLVFCKESFLSIEAPNVLLASLKKSEDSNSFVMRLYETVGKQTDCDLKLHTRLNPKKIEEISIDERCVLNTYKESNCIKLKFKPFEIRTIRVFL